MTGVAARAYVGLGGNVGDVETTLADKPTGCPLQSVTAVALVATEERPLMPTVNDREPEHPMELVAVTL